MEESQEEPDHLEQVQNEINIIYGAFVAAIGTYGLVAYYITNFVFEQAIIKPYTQMYWGLIGVFSLISLSTIGVSLYAFPLFFNLDTSGDNEIQESTIGGAWTTTSILRSAMLDTIAIYGLFLTILFDDITYFLVFGTVSLVLLFLKWPTTQELLKHLKSMQDVHESDMPDLDLQ